MTRRMLLATPVLALGLLAPGCGGDDGDADDAPDAGGVTDTVGEALGEIEESVEDAFTRNQ